MNGTAKRALITIGVLVFLFVGIWFIYWQSTRPYRELEKAAEDFWEGVANWRENMGLEEEEE